MQTQFIDGHSLEELANNRMVNRPLRQGGILYPYILFEILQKFIRSL
jgi:hypothetical protein